MHRSAARSGRLAGATSPLVDTAFAAPLVDTTFAAPAVDSEALGGKRDSVPECPRPDADGPPPAPRACPARCPFTWDDLLGDDPDVHALAARLATA